MLLRDKTAVVTGCAKGIGKEIVRVFAENGADVIACIRKYDADFLTYIQRLESEYDIVITPVYFDLSDETQILEAVKTIRANYKTIDILVNNAGIANDTIFQMTNIKFLEEKLKVNVYAPFIFTQYIVKLMRKSNHPSIINISSIAAEDNFKGMITYNMSKSAINSFTKSLANELGALNIRVNAIAPGFTETQMIEDAVNNNDFLQEMIKSSALRRLAKPEEIANSVLFLASELSSYITGQILRVDGGFYYD